MEASLLSPSEMYTSKGKYGVPLPLFETIPFPPLHGHISLFLLQARGRDRRKNKKEPRGGWEALLRTEEIRDLIM